MRVDGVAATRSIVGRLAGAAMLIALAAVAALLLVTYAVVSAATTRALSDTVDIDVAGLADIHATSGRRELVTRIKDREALKAQPGQRAYYLLLYAGRPIAGDLTRWPSLSAERSEAGYVTLGGEPAYARATRIGPMLDLLVAREASRGQATLHQLIVAFLISGAVIVGAVTAVAWIWFARLTKRLRRINLAYEIADAATLSNDVARDEIGELARRSGHALARMDRILLAQRHVSDHVAHDLRTPLLHLDRRLAGLMGSADAETCNVLATGRSDIRGITTMLDALLDIAANEASYGSSDGMLDVDVSAIVVNLAELYQSSMEEAGLRFESIIHPGVVMRGQAMQIGRMVANLLDNAIRYVPAGGTVRVTVSDDACITVEDDGPGIADALRDTIFDRFRVGQESGVGHGLGLALARSIAVRHGMTLTVSDNHPGCRFVARPVFSA